MKKEDNKNLWDKAKAILRRKITVIHANIRKEENDTIDNQKVQIKQQKNPKTSKEKEITKTRVKIKVNEIKKTTQRIHETRR